MPTLRKTTKDYIIGEKGIYTREQFIFKLPFLRVLFLLQRSFFFIISNNEVFFGSVVVVEINCFERKHEPVLME